MNNNPHSQVKEEELTMQSQGCSEIIEAENQLFFILIFILKTCIRLRISVISDFAVPKCVAFDAKNISVYLFSLKLETLSWKF